MFDSKSPVIKVTGYIIIGFFALIIIISFGMPDFLSQMGIDKSTAAIVNGQKVHIYDFLKFRDSRFGRLNNPQLEQYVFNQFLGRVLVVQEAEKAGFSITQSRISSSIKDISAFKTGDRYDAEKFKLYLKNAHYSLNEFYKTMRYDLLNGDYVAAMKMGLYLPEDEVAAEFTATNSTFSVKVSQLPLSALQKKFSATITVSDAEISEALKKEKTELKDPESDRKRISEEIKKEKLKALIAGYTRDLDDMKKKGASFEALSNKMQGTVLLSKPFAPGETVTVMNKEVVPLQDLSGSDAFTAALMKLKTEEPSDVIVTASNLYIISIVDRKIGKNADAKPEDLAKLRKKMEDEEINALYGRYMQALFEQSKIQKLFKN